MKEGAKKEHRARFFPNDCTKHKDPEKPFQLVVL